MNALLRTAPLALIAALVAPAASADTPPAAAANPAAAAAPAGDADPLAWRSTPPGPGADTGWEVPTPVRFTLGNGIPVYLVQRPDLPLVSVQLRIAASRDVNPAGKAGLAHLVAAMLDEGTRTRPALQIAEDAESLGANLSVGTTDEASYVTLDALTDALEPSLDLLADVASNPAFQQADLDRVKNDVLTELARRASDPPQVARAAFARAAFGDAHPYGYLDIGTRESVRSITRKDVQDFYKSWWHAGNAALVVAGNVDQARAQALLEARFGKWKARKDKRPVLPAVSNPPKVKLLFVEQPGSVQSVIAFGHLSIPRSSPDYAATKAMLALLGGMFSSRINMNLREEHGWSYGAYAGLADGTALGMFRGSTSVQADATAPAVAEILKEIREMRQATPSAAELQLAKDSLRGDIAGVFETNSGAAGFFATLPTFRLPDDAWRTYLQQVRALTPEQVQAAAASQLSPDNLVIVVAGPGKVTAPGEDGQPKEIDVAAALSALGLGEVQRISSAL